MSFAPLYNNDKIKDDILFLQVPCNRQQNINLEFLRGLSCEANRKLQLEYVRGEKRTLTQRKQTKD